ncbi:autoinducer binding domain-containing protein [Pelomonas sp. APW6]|jgi:DNA-binding CsgD family transcriptional regulator|uniref:Autoinducer binding domain-containing protein n=1 Tax=Roseateles subflavus TaxID=3053353 RepID=A0ABT7LCY4_9BURK|nr:autoinducer binding domain-containing protein [Pelomonas sp. APW6]MDL5030719.1 autoinducer binding domain-containing protein [Pelomonas sp. APW6]
MLQGSFQSVLEAKNRDEFREEIVRFAQDLGFETVTATVVLDRGPGNAEFLSVDNAPVGFNEIAYDPSLGKLDPVMQHVKRHSVPIIWSQFTYVQNGRADLWEEQARFGYCSGICLALHLPEGRHFIMGVDRREALPSDHQQLTRVVADLQLFAVHAQEAAWNVFLPEGASLEQPLPSLTPRELECLRWTMEGKTAWEVGGILGISERTAVLHLNNAMHKMDCNNKHQAVLKALRLGLIR